MASSISHSYCSRYHAHARMWKQNYDRLIICGGSEEAMIRQSAYKIRVIRVHILIRETCYRSVYYIVIYMNWRFADRPATGWGMRKTLKRFIEPNIRARTIRGQLSSPRPIVDLFAILFAKRRARLIVIREICIAYVYIQYIICVYIQYNIVLAYLMVDYEYDRRFIFANERLESRARAISQES